MSGAIGAAGVVFGLLVVPQILAQSTHFPIWFDIVAVAIVFGAPLALGPVSLWGSVGATKRVAGVAAVGYLVVIALWVPALLPGGLGPDSDSPWITSVTAIATTAAAIAWRGAPVAAYVVVTALLVGVARYGSNPAVGIQTAILDAIFTLMFSTIFTSLATVSQRSAHLLDKAAASASVEVARSAGSQAARRERARFQALMHDSILSTLLVAAEDSPTMRSAVAAQARATLTRLDALSEESVDDQPLDPDEFVRVLRAAVTEADPAAQFTSEVLSETVVPGPVAATMSEAMTEALRNSLKHASAPFLEVNRAVHVRVADRSVEVAIIDEGRGFDPATVQAGRMGLAVSIRGRMEHLESGSATVSSAVGRGTAVTLAWNRS